MPHLRFWIFLILLLPAIASGQSRRLLNQPKYDTRPLHFGFSLGLNYTDFYIRKYDLAQVPGYYSVRSEVNPGYTIRIVSDLRLHENLSLRFVPGFAATVRYLYFEVDDRFTGLRTEVFREVESAYIEMPFELKFRGDRIDNHRWYLLAGIKHNIDLASKQDVDDDEFFKLKRHDFGYELGVGIDIYFEYFKLSPQLIASFGQTNLLVMDDTKLIEGINTIQTRAILINFTFE
jgi:hypothetical protein